jgi:hypothetical protein
MPDLTSSKKGERGLDRSLVEISREGPGTQ